MKHLDDFLFMVSFFGLGFFFFLDYNWVYIVEMGRNKVFILKIHQTTEAELQGNICIAHNCIGNTSKTMGNPLIF